MISTIDTVIFHMNAPGTEAKIDRVHSLRFENARILSFSSLNYCILAVICTELIKRSLAENRGCAYI